MTISRIHTSTSNCYSRVYRQMSTMQTKNIFIFRLTAAAVSQVGVTHTPDRVHGSYHWDAERAASAALVPLMAAQLAVGANPVTDVLLGVVLPVHLHIGM